LLSGATNDEAAMIYLTKTDPSRNMARFYVLDVQPTLFGEWALLKVWGRIVPLEFLFRLFKLRDSVARP
jgi:hypothetical protein